MLHGAKCTRPVARTRLALPVLLAVNAWIFPSRETAHTGVVTARPSRRYVVSAIYHESSGVALAIASTLSAVANIISGQWPPLLYTATLFHISQSLALGHDLARDARSQALDPEHRMIGRIGQSPEGRRTW
jgi:hypothetical protein